MSLLSASLNCLLFPRTLSSLSRIIKGMPRNVEIKARVEDKERLVKLAKELSGDKGSVLIQHDIFFNSPNGRLKMRSVEQDGKKRTELIWYDRPDVAGPKLSDFKKYDVPEDIVNDTKDTLALSMGIKGDVEKERVLYMHEQTRIHVDSVKGLGDFMELEVCLRDDQSMEDGERIANEIRQALEVSEDCLLTGAYMDMLSKQ